jgi:hypothetical protein
VVQQTRSYEVSILLMDLCKLFVVLNILGAQIRGIKASDLGWQRTWKVATSVEEQTVNGDTGQNRGIEAGGKQGRCPDCAGQGLRFNLSEGIDQAEVGNRRKGHEMVHVELELDIASGLVEEYTKESSDAGSVACTLKDRMEPSRHGFLKPAR